MKCLNDGIVDPFYNYNILIGFGIFVLFLTGFMFYTTIASFAKNSNIRLLAFIVSILYTMGYPLNSLLFGFEYFSIGILILGAIIASCNIYQKGQIGYKQNLLVFFLLNFGLFNAYYMFVPYTYSACWIYFCYQEYKKQKKLFTKRTFTMLFVTLLLPFFLGYIYNIEPGIYGVLIKKGLDTSELLKNADNLINEKFAIKGYIYVNLFSNMLLLLPFSILSIVKNWKEEKAVGLMTIFNIVFILILLVGNKLGKVSYYYLSKNYFSLWLFLFYLTYKGIILKYENNKYISTIPAILYVGVVVVTLIFGNGNLTHGEANPNENILQVTDIYLANKKILLEKPVDLTKDELEILKYAKENLEQDKLIEVAGNPEQGYWAYAITRRINDDEPKIRGETKLSVKMAHVGKRAGKVDYMIYFNRGFFYKYYQEVLLKDTEVVYENSAGGILKYTNPEY